MKKLLAALALVACAGSAHGSITVITPDLTGHSVGTMVSNVSGLTIDWISFDLSPTHSNVPGNVPLVLGRLNIQILPLGVTATLDGVGTSLFRFDYTGFRTDLFHWFDWDPDTAADPRYPARVVELVGTLVTASIGGVGYSGVMVLDRLNDRVIADIVIPVPGALLLFASGLAGLGVCLRRRPCPAIAERV
jgi:hypothetical protein